MTWLDGLRLLLLQLINGHLIRYMLNSNVKFNYVYCEE